MTNTLSGAVIPQRANVLLTSAFALPGFDMKLRAFRVYKPVADTTKAIGYKFASDGTALWTAKTPMADYCNDASASCRNIYHAAAQRQHDRVHRGQRRPRSART